MNIEKKREYLLKKLSEKENLVYKYDSVMGPGLLLKIQRLFLLRKKYLQYCLVRMGIFRNREVKVKVFCGEEIILPLQDGSAFCLYYCGTLNGEECKLTRFLIKNLKQDEIFYDIGANYGFYSLLAKEIITKGELHAFEPHPKLFTYLEKTFSKGKNDRVFLNNCAISNKNKICSFFDGFEAHCSEFSTTSKKVAMGRSAFLYRKTKTKAIKLVSYIKRHSFPTFIKLDIEGGEAKAIEGAYNTLKKHSPTIAMEVWGGESGEKFSSKAVNLLYKLGYKSYAISKDGEIRLMPEINFNQIKNDCENFIFKK